jgi:hypothetical protein
MRVCDCGCGAEFEPRQASHRFASSRCRARDWKRRNGYVDPRRAAKPSKPYRNASQVRLRRKPDLRISYRRAVDALSAALDGASLDTRHRAFAALSDLLTDRQRTAL